MEFHTWVSLHFSQGEGEEDCSVVSNSLQPQWTVAYQDPLSMGFSRQ